MKELNKFIWLAIALSLIASVTPFIRDIYLARVYGAEGAPYSIEQQWVFVTLIIVGLQNIAAALWLYSLSAKYHSSKLTWTAFGLFFGLISVGIYYLVRINERLET
jgi:hypothetical protein